MPKSESIQKKIANLVDKIIDNKEEIELYKNELNQLIFDYYELNDNQIQHLTDAIKAF